jgi:pimeloyl-ACP methyl ester carboxylesterase
MFRIMNDDIKNGKRGAPVVFMQHGLLSSARNWFENEKDKAVAY